MMRWRWGKRFRAMGWMLTGFATLVPAACSRYDHVRDADEQAYRLVAEKSDDPRWAQPDFAVDLDPRSRYFDPYDHISPPRPPDDPASHRYMERVDGKKHYPYWDQFGLRPELENPTWECDLPEYVEVNAEGKILLGLEEAMRLAIIHRPDYQEQFETVYLSALDVSTERFRFDTQFFGSFFSGYENRGPEVGNIARSPSFSRLNPPNSSSQWNLNSSLVASRRLATAGELLVGFANSTVWELVGRNSNISTSVLNFSFVQPLLRAGGRAFALEQLTIVERALLANLRALERYRHGFFTEVAIGSSGVQGPRRRGGFFGGTGLTGFTGQGSGGFGGVGGATGFGGGFGGGAGGAGGAAGGTGFAGGGAGTVDGFLGLLQRTQQIRNSEQSLEAQLSVLELLEDTLQAGLIDIAQVDQFRQSIETERATLLQAQVGFRDAMDRYLTGTLGLPPDLPVELKEDFILPLRFTSDAVMKVQSELTSITDAVREQSENPTAQRSRSLVEQTQNLLPEIDKLVELIRADLAQVDEKAESRKAGMSARDQAAFDEAREKMAEDVQSVVTALREAAVTIEQLQDNLETAGPQATADAVATLTRDLQNLVGELSTVQARARLAVINVEEVSLTSEKALEIARAHRLDWMNNRAALVDTWRLIQFNAQALRSNLTLRVDGDLSTLGGDNPFKFRDETGTVRASLQFDPPFTRLTERNNFRQQLIEYQQSRRQLIQFEDGVHQSMRQTLRNLDQLKTNLEIQRRAVTIAINRVEQTREDLNRPVPPPLPGERVEYSPTALNLLSALSDLRNAQNNFLSVWLNYYSGRMILMRDLGLMRLDENGMWIDEPLDLALAAAMQYSCEEFPPEVPENWFGPDACPVILPEAPETYEPLCPPLMGPFEDEKPRANSGDMPACRPRGPAEDLILPAAQSK